MSGTEPAFACLTCGACCFGAGGVRLTQEEAVSAAAYLKIKIEGLKRFYLKGSAPPWEVGTDPEGYCLFHQSDGRCLIHPAKPAVCRTWPFLPGPLKEESAFLDAKAACPGLREDLGWAEFKKAARAAGYMPVRG